MMFANETAETAYRVLNKCACEMEPSGTWCWQCVVKNGARLNLAASFDEGFLQLACRLEAIHKTTLALEDAMLCNKTLTGGVKLALDPASRGLHLRTDIVVLNEEQLQTRLEWALQGFHDGNRLLKSPNSLNDYRISQTVPDSGVDLAELLHESSWPCAERGPNDFTAALDASAAPPASIRMKGNCLALSVELLRCNATADITRQALAIFLLTASCSLRMVRAYAEHADEQICFGFLVSLPSSPATEEIQHALAALSVAFRVCARETNVLLHSAAATHYLAARNPSITDDHQHKKEN
ncbi:MAG: hypothetical protein ABSB30_05740 [Terracidiphilus sp.]|jgi:hypothetical protein